MLSPEGQRGRDLLLFIPLQSTPSPSHIASSQLCKKNPDRESSCHPLCTSYLISIQAGNQDQLQIQKRLKQHPLRDITNEAVCRLTLRLVINHPKESHQGELSQ
ncbi:Hypothetical predicted protein [Pelobates cultripes]|uniref:Uncharacterized protein n=1 Tax=Pelobates cultripes TaxID=61616 RepID=A0AAD1TI07_PELCU|nr:Hypothetical predicted protein [Pelobates cultripes]